MALSTTQRGVLAGMSLGGLLSLLGLLVGLWAAPDALTPGDDLPARLAFALGWDLLVIFWLITTIGLLARLRFFSPQDIDGAGLTTGTAAAKTQQALLQNTLEQVVLAVVVHLASAILLPRDDLAVLPIAAIFFTLGRALFCFGYRRGAAARALGFALTFYPTVLLFILLVGRYVAAVSGVID
jgi:hypothetical protein|tara:strand:- start:393 stop:941 length:549 start_codon:yes stop_codon:yes gene_type:complete